MQAMKCPRDGSDLTAKIYEAKIEVDECGSCQGTWLDKGELEAIQATVERDYSKELSRAPNVVRDSAEAVAQEKRGPIACPKCNAEMDVRPYGMGSQVVIDVCPAGCGLWLDKGELAALEQFFERSQAETEIPITWRMWASVISVFKRPAKSK
jgi:Zn-finger nucleic acid-binding protein